VTTLFAFLFVLGVLVFIHELGHFLAARRLGVRVLTFSLGFGPKLLKIKRGETE
jgi:regulator of sigma E protease